jgi:hypothetical protein
VSPGICFPCLQALLLVVTALCSLVALAEPNVLEEEALQEELITPPAAEPPPPTHIRMLRGLERGHDHISRGVGYISSGLDNWMAGDDEPKAKPEKKDHSYVRVRMKEDYFEGGIHESDYSIRGHLDLPHTKKRLRLFFDTDDTDNETLVNKKLLNSNAGGSEQVAGVSRDKTTKWYSIRHDVGVRGSLPFDPFYRFRFRTGTPLADKWRVDFEQRAWYYDSKGSGEESQLRFSRPLGNSRILSFNSDVQFQDHENLLEFGQSVGILKILGPLEALRYEVGALGGNQPESRINQYYLQTGYSRSLHEDWLIFTVTPQLAFPRLADWEPKAGLFLSLDIYFYAL